MTRLMAILLMGFACATGVQAQPPGEYSSYQRTRGDWQGHHHRKRHHDSRWRNHGRYEPPQVSGGSFQRPYPYHLDYYRMRWGGSYAPYFGNLYGPPNVVLGAPYTYGGYYGGFGNGQWQVPYQAPPMVEIEP